MHKEKLQDASWYEGERRLRALLNDRPDRKEGFIQLGYFHVADGRPLLPQHPLSQPVLCTWSQTVSQSRIESSGGGACSGTAGPLLRDSSGEASHSGMPGGVVAPGNPRKTNPARLGRRRAKSLRGAAARRCAKDAAVSLQRQLRPWQRQRGPFRAGTSVGAAKQEAAFKKVAGPCHCRCSQGRRCRASP